MTLNSEMKDHMDAVRKITGVSGLLSLASSTDVLKQLSGIRLGLNDYYTGSLDDIEDSSILFVTGPSQANGANKAVSVKDQNSPVDDAWLIVLTFVSPLGGGRKWQIAIPDNACKAFLRIGNSKLMLNWINLGGGSKCFPKISKRFNVLLSPTKQEGGVTLVA